MFGIDATAFWLMLLFVVLISAIFIAISRYWSNFMTAGFENETVEDLLEAISKKEQKQS